jgi:hypothetical protein
MDTAVVRVNPTNGAPIVDVWATAGPNDAPSVTVAGVTVAMTRNTNPASNPTVPSGFTNPPTTYMATVALPSGSTSWILDVSVTAAAVTQSLTVRPALTGSAIYTGNVLTVRNKAVLLHVITSGS